MKHEMQRVIKVSTRVHKPAVLPGREFHWVKLVSSRMLLCLMLARSNASRAYQYPYSRLVV